CFEEGAAFLGGRRLAQFLTQLFLQRVAAHRFPHRLVSRQLVGCLLSRNRNGNGSNEDNAQAGKRDSLHELISSGPEPTKRSIASHHCGTPVMEYCLPFESSDNTTWLGRMSTIL